MHTIAAFAGSIPANYEKYLGPFLFEPYALDLISRIQDKEYDHILELACGTGRVTAHITMGVKYKNLTATDLNPDMINVARRIVKDESVTWAQADALNIPFADNTFDLVVMQFGIMFLPDKQKGIEEIYRVLRPGGKLIFNTWDRAENNPALHTGRQIIESYFGDDPPVFYSIPFSMYDPDELKLLLESAGFENVNVTLVKKESISTAEDLAVGMVEGNPIYLTITERDPSLIEPIKKHVQQELGKRHGEKPLKSKLQAWVVEGKKLII